jgi:hypothetical protein
MALVHCDTSALYQYLTTEIFPQLAPPPYGKLEIRQLSVKKPVYLFYERRNKLKVIGKFFGSESVPLEEAWRWAEKGYSNLNQARERFGMNKGTYRVVAPLGLNRELCALLVTELAPGKVLDHYIARAIYRGESAGLFEKLTCLARFFVKLHRNSETHQRVAPDLPRDYLGKLLDSLQQGPLTGSERYALEKHVGKWWENGDIFSDHEVVVHGDATPTNFFLHRHEVVGIDLDKMKYADCCWDLGFMAAELKHHFLWRTGDSWAAEPFIGHFLWDYAATYSGEQFFRAITRKLPLYMTLGLLRIARNTWLDEPYRIRLIKEAKRCLKYGL